jgi:anthranilate phosphoribosyltransferase
MIKEIAEKIIGGNYLKYEELKELVNSMRNDELNDLEFVSILAAMETRNRIKGIDADECADFVRALRMPVSSDLEGILCNAGTGGDKIKTINVSTSATIVLATAGIKVLKIGYKGVTGRFGSRDLLLGWGIDPFQPLENVVESVKKVGIGYFDFSKVVVKEKRSGFRSPLNYLGPLCNPFRLTYKILGCADKSHLRVIEPIIDKICNNYLLIYNRDIDEASTISPTFVKEKRNKIKKEYILNPNELNLIHVSYTDLSPPQSLKENSDIIINIFKGERSQKSELIALNAALGLYLTGKSETIKDGFYEANQLLSSGKVLNKLEEWIAFSNDK